MEIIQKLIQVVSYLTVHYQELLAAGLMILGALHAFLLALIAFFTLIPGPQPEGAIQKFADWVEKYSKK